MEFFKGLRNILPFVLLFWLMFIALYHYLMENELGTYLAEVLK